MLSQETLDYFAQLNIEVSLKQPDLETVFIRNFKEPIHRLFLPSERDLWDTWFGYSRNYFFKRQQFEHLYTLRDDPHYASTFEKAFEFQDWDVLHDLHQQLFGPPPGLDEFQYIKMPEDWKEQIVAAHQTGLFAHFLESAPNPPPFEAFEKYCILQTQAKLQTSLPENDTSKVKSGVRL